MTPKMPSTVENFINKSRIELEQHFVSSSKSDNTNNCSPFLKQTAATAATTVHSAGFLTVIYTWFVCIFAGTFTKAKYFSAFNVIQNYKELTSAKISKLTCIDYFRVFAILWVMINHAGSEGRIDILERLPTAQTFKNNVHNHIVFGPFFGNSALGVEIFLVLSGLLAARSWSRINQRKNNNFTMNYIELLIRRAMRLFPSVAVFIYLAQSNMSSVYMPRFYNTMISTCGWKGLVSHLTFTGNWQSTPTCLGYLWYLGLDFQLYALAPFLMTFLMYNTKIGIIIITTLVVISSIIRANICRFYNICNNSDVDIPFISYPNQTTQDLEKIYRGLWDIYSRPCTKCGPFFIGIIAGYISTKFTEKPNININIVKLLNVLSIFGIIFCIFGILPEYWYPDAGNTTYNTFYTATFRSIFAICISWLIIYGIYWYKTQFSLLFNVLAQLTFQAYLLHMPVVYLFNHVKFLQTANGPWEVLLILPGVAIISYTGALIMYLLVEAPMAKITGSIYENIKNYILQKKFL